MSIVIGCNWKSEIVLPVNWKIEDSVKIISCCLNTTSPVISAPTEIVPDPVAGEKSSSENGAVKVSMLLLPKNSWFLKLITNSAASTSVGASLSAVNVVPSYRAGTLIPSTIAIFSSPV